MRNLGLFALLFVGIFVVTVAVSIFVMAFFITIAITFGMLFVFVVTVAVAFGVVAFFITITVAFGMFVVLVVIAVRVVMFAVAVVMRMFIRSAADQKQCCNEGCVKCFHSGETFSTPEPLGKPLKRTEPHLFPGPFLEWKGG